MFVCWHNIHSQHYFYLLELLTDGSSNNCTFNNTLHGNGRSSELIWATEVWHISKDAPFNGASFAFSNLICSSSEYGAAAVSAKGVGRTAVHSHHYFYLLELLTDGSTKVVFALILTIHVATLLPVLLYYQHSVAFMPLGT